MKTNLKAFSIALLVVSQTSLFAEPNFIFGENPALNNVVLQKVAAKTPYRLLSSKDPSGYVLELDDGSTWRVSGADGARAVSDWRINDSVVIFPCFFPAWTGTRFYILNERTRNTANVELSLGPISGRSTYNHITELNLFHGTLCITDGTGHNSQWIINRKDLKKFQNWKLNQTIILGFMESSYSGWFSREPYILINVERNEFIEANIL